MGEKDIESQSEGHMAMPVRNMVYDALQYARQVEETAKSHKKAAKETTELSEKKKSLTSVEYLGGFYKEDRLVPVITLVASDAGYRELDIKAARVIRAITGSKLKFDKKEKKVDMGNALDEIWEDGNREGRLEGRGEGEMLKSISLIQKKAEKNIAPVQIADMLEEEIVFVEQICHLIQKYPEADKETLFDYWTAQQKGS